MRTTRDRLPSGHEQLRKQLRRFKVELANRVWIKIIDSVGPDEAITWDMFEAALKEAVKEAGQQRAVEPSLDTDLAGRAMEEYARGESCSVQDIINDLRRAGPEVGAG